MEAFNNWVTVAPQSLVLDLKRVLQFCYYIKQGFVKAVCHHPPVSTFLKDLNNVLLDSGKGICLLNTRVCAMLNADD